MMQDNVSLTTSDNRDVVSAGAATSASSRIWFLDTLRYILVLAVVVLHAVESQFTFANDWAVDDPRATPVADQILLFLDIMLMSILFFIAGYFTVQTIQRRGVTGFWRRKFCSLLVPATLTVVLINPIWKYVYQLTRAWAAGDVPKGYLEAWWGFLTSIKWYEAGNIHSLDFTLLHVWFISLLLAFYIPVTILAARLKRDSQLAIKPRTDDYSTNRISWLIVRSHVIAWPFAAIGILLLTPAITWWAFGPVLLFEPIYIPQYVVYFGLGLHAYRHQWFARPGLFGNRSVWVLTFAVSVTGYLTLVQYMIFHPELLDSKSLMLAAWFLRYFACASSLVILLILAQRFWNSPSPIHRHLAAHSIHFYLLHPAIVVIVQLGFLLLPNLNWLTCLIGTSLLSLVGTYIFSIAVATLATWLPGCGRQPSRG